MSMEVPLGDTYYFLFTTRQFSTGAPFTLAGTPALSVYEENNLTQITSGVSVTADYDSVTGLNECSIVATGANGYEAGKYYSVVITTGTVDSVSVVGEVVGHFRVMPAEDAGAGIKDVNATHVGDTSQTGGDLASLITTVDTVVDGIQTDLDNGTDGLGAIKADTAAILDDTGTNGVLLAATATSAQLVDDIWDETIAASDHNVANSAAKRLREVATIAVTDTAQAGAAGTITLAAGASSSDDIYNGEQVTIIDGTGAGQARLITDYNGTTKVATVDRNWTVNPDSTSVYSIQGADADIRSIEGDDAAADNLLAMFDGTGYAGGTTKLDVNTVNVGGTAQTAGDLAALITTVDTVVDGIQTDLDNGTDGLGALKTLIDALNDISTADVNAQVVDVLRTDTSTLPGQEAPTATPTLEEAIMFLYKAWRNKSTQTATTYSLYADDTTTVDQKATVSDDGTTATKGEVATGP